MADGVPGPGRRRRWWHRAARGPRDPGATGGARGRQTHRRGAARRPRRARRRGGRAGAAAPARGVGGRAVRAGGGSAVGGRPVRHGRGRRAGRAGPCAPTPARAAARSSPCRCTCARGAPGALVVENGPGGAALREAALWVGEALDRARLEASAHAAVQAELRALRAEISPHCRLQQPLTVIASFVASDTEWARDLTLDFAHYTRHSSPATARPPAWPGSSAPSRPTWRSRGPCSATGCACRSGSPGDPSRRAALPGAAAPRGERGAPRCRADRGQRPRPGRRGGARQRLRHHRRGRRPGLDPATPPRCSPGGVTPVASAGRCRPALPYRVRAGVRTGGRAAVVRGIRVVLRVPRFQPGVVVS